MYFGFVQSGWQDTQRVAFICPYYHCIVVFELGLYGPDCPGFRLCVVGLSTLYTLRSSTGFEQHAAHPQDDQLYHLWYRHSSQTAVQYTGGDGLQSALHLYTVRLFTEGDDTRGCGDTIGPPEDEQRAARNLLRIVV